MRYGLLTFFFLSASLSASYSEKEWGVGAVQRVATIPFRSEYDDATVSSFVPLLYFQGETLYLDGTEFGGKFYTDAEQNFEMYALTRLRFVDMPRVIQNEEGEDTADFGLKATYSIDDTFSVDLELMTDSHFYLHSNFVVYGEYEQGNLEFTPKLTLRAKSSEFNSEYYALQEKTGQSIGEGIDVNFGIDMKYHVASNLYLLGGAGVTYLDKEAYQADIVQDRWQGEFYAGLGFFNNKSEPKRDNLSISPYVKVAHGFATPTSLGDILLRFKSNKDEYNNQLSSVFYGYPLTDKLFGYDIDVYLTPGIAHHWHSEVQSSSTEYVAAIKAYYTFNWPTKWRFGVAEGLSYIDKVTYIEESSLSKYENTSNLLNYLDISYDVNLGDLFNHRDWDNVWFGYSLHHRSAIFEKSSQFGRIKGGSNYNTIYIQVDF